MSHPRFDQWTEVYEALVDWPKRLAHEEPFYRQWFEETGARRVLDAACGTGRHAAMFHGWDLDVQGADVSPEMIQLARRQHGQSDSLRWMVRSFDQPVVAQQPFDAIVCVGNSLALAADRETVQRAIVQMLAGLRSGGRILIHLLNLWRLPDGPCVWQKCLRTRIGTENALILKGVHRSGRQGYVNLVVAGTDDKPAMEHDSVPFLGLRAEELEAMARKGGAHQIAFYGGYNNQPYRPDESVDLVMVAGS